MRYSYIVACLVWLTGSGAASGFTTQENYTNYNGWHVTAEHLLGDQYRFCRAVNTVDGHEISLLYGDLSAPYGRLLISLVARDVVLPEGYEGSALLMLSDDVIAPGEVMDVGDWKGGVRMAHYARFAFPELLDVKDALRTTSTWHISAEHQEVMTPINITIDLAGVLDMLDVCYEDNDATPENNPLEDISGDAASGR